MVTLHFYNQYSLEETHASVCISYVSRFFFTFRNSPLQIQSRLPRGKNTAIYKELAAASNSEDDGMDVDSQPQQESESTREGRLKDQLDFFSRGMKSWTMLDVSFKEFLKRFTEKVLRETPTDVRNPRLALTLSYLKTIHYGVSNNMAHLSGQLISKAIKESKTSYFLNNLK